MKKDFFSFDNKIDCLNFIQKVWPDVCNKNT